MLRIRGLEDRVDEIALDPWTDTQLRAKNPLAKVPTLVLDDGTALYESGVICDYLDMFGAAPRLIPAEGTERWRALRLQALADGAALAAGRLYADERRAEDDRSAFIMARQRDALQAALDALQAALDALQVEDLRDENWTIGEVTAAVLLDYLDFRWPDHTWRRGRQHLSDWADSSAKRPEMAATRHPASI